MGQCTGKPCFFSHRGVANQHAKPTSPTLLVQQSSCKGGAFAFGKLVAVDAPRSAGEKWQDYKGQTGTVKSKRHCPAEGFLYTLRFETAADLVDVPERFLKKAGVLARSSNVAPLNLGSMLAASPLRIPVFQRRYCWSESQWRLLWQSVVDVRDNPERNAHSLGRIMLFQHSDGTRLVLDGQQRLTTSVLLLTVLRHRLEMLGHSASDLAALANDRFLPTMDDREDFRKCLVDSNASGESCMLQAVRVFRELASTLDAEACRDTANAVLHRLTALAFVVDTPEALQSVFEGMARKSQLMQQLKGTELDLNSCAQCFASGEGGHVVASTHLGPNGDRMCAACAAKTPGAQPMTPGMPMVPLDLIRNFVVDHFATEPRMVEMHALHWRPLEAMYQHDVASLEAALEDFLDGQGHEVASRWALYSSFTAWWRAADADLPQDDIEDRAVVKLLQLRKSLQDS